MEKLSIKEVRCLIQDLRGLSGFERGFLLADPLLEIVRRALIDDDRHEAMIAVAERRTMAPIQAFLAGRHPDQQFGDETGEGVALGAEIRDPSGVNDILRG